MTSESLPVPTISNQLQNLIINLTQQCAYDKHVVCKHTTYMTCDYFRTETLQQELQQQQQKQTIVEQQQRQQQHHGEAIVTAQASVAVAVTAPGAAAEVAAIAASTAATKISCKPMILDKTAGWFATSVEKENKSKSKLVITLILHARATA